MSDSQTRDKKKQINTIKRWKKEGLGKRAIAIGLENELDIWRAAIVDKALQRGLQEDKVLHFVKKGFDERQLGVIYLGFLEGFSDIQVAMYAKPEFDWMQMSEIYFGLKDGLTDKQINTYAQPEFSSARMAYLRTALKQKIGKERSFDKRRVMSMHYTRNLLD